jgi:putative MATE family efflux protein
MVLAPFLIFGWGTGRPLGAPGAAVATLIAVVTGSAWLLTWFLPRTAWLRFVRADLAPQPRLWADMLRIGLPAGAEFALMAVYLFLVYALIRPFGSAAQAGFGIGMRILQAGFMPVVALGFSVAPVAGQNFGARHAQRVRDAFRMAALLATAVMLPFAVLCHVAPVPMIRVFTDDPAVIAVGDEYLRILSWNFVASGLVFVSSSMFQAIGNTLPALLASFTRLLVVAIPAALLSRLPGFELRWIWMLTVASVTLQMGLSLLLLRRELRQRLRFDETAVAA